MIDVFEARCLMKEAQSENRRKEYENALEKVSETISNAAKLGRESVVVWLPDKFDSFIINDLEKNGFDIPCAIGYMPTTQERSYEIRWD